MIEDLIFCYGIKYLKIYKVYCIDFLAAWLVGLKSYDFLFAKNLSKNQNIFIIKKEIHSVFYLHSFNTHFLFSLVLWQIKEFLQFQFEIMDPGKPIGYFCLLSKYLILIKTKYLTKMNFNYKSSRTAPKITV